MSIRSVIFLGKSKKKTGNTRFMLKGLRHRVPQAAFLNVPRYRKLYFWTNYQQHIYRRILAYNPELVLIYSQDIPFEVLQKIKSDHITAIFYPDGHNPPKEKLLRSAREVDYFFFTNKTQIDDFKTLGVRNPIFCLQGCDAEEHRIVPTQNRKWAAQVAFIGRPSAAHRVELLKSVHQAYNLKAWGAQWDAHGFRCPKVSVYPHHSTQECLDMIDYYLRHPEKRRMIAAGGYEYVHTTRTYDIVMDEIITRIESERISNLFQPQHTI